MNYEVLWLGTVKKLVDETPTEICLCINKNSLGPFSLKRNRILNQCFLYTVTSLFIEGYTDALAQLPSDAYEVFSDLFDNGLDELRIDLRIKKIS